MLKLFNSNYITQDVMAQLISNVVLGFNQINDDKPKRSFFPSEKDLNGLKAQANMDQKKNVSGQPKTKTKKENQRKINEEQH